MGDFKKGKKWILFKYVIILNNYFQKIIVFFENSPIIEVEIKKRGYL